MTLFAQLNGVPVTKGRITIPASGLWHADVWLDRVSDTTGPQSLVVNGITGTCAVVRQIDFAGETSVRLVAGAGGWSTQVPPAFYTNPQLSTVLNDAAGLVGEQVNVTADAAIPFFMRELGAASSVLQELLGDAWYVDFSGVVQQGFRPATTISSPFTLRSVQGPPGVYEVESDTIEDWVPGASFSCPTGSGIVSRVTHVLSAGRLHTEVMVPTASAAPTDRLRASFESVLAQYLPNLLYAALWPYTVVSASGGGASPVKIDATSNDPRMKDVSQLVLRPDAAGSVAVPAVGSSVLIGFVAMDPKQPEVRALDPDNPPTAIYVGQGVNPVARLGDQVQCFLPPALPFVGASGAGPVTGTITGAGPISGCITQGSQKANSS